VKLSTDLPLVRRLRISGALDLHAFMALARNILTFFTLYTLHFTSSRFNNQCIKITFGTRKNVTVFKKTHHAYGFATRFFCLYLLSFLSHLHHNINAFSIVS